MAPKRALVTLLALATVALLGVGLAQLLETGSGVKPLAKLTVAQMRSRLAGSPAPLASLHAQAGQVLAGGEGALRRRLGKLAGYPVVVNKWASWCVPCRSEFGAFQHAAVDFGRQVAFVGIDSGDTSRSSAEAFLRSTPVSYPSYYDASGQLGLAVTDSSFTPVTVFIAKDGRRYVHQGPYPSLQKLERDVRRYALNA
jgi:cytochrome c biogenesis protein CcmG, thiol:disulfide interchange protein DsbE